MFCESLSKCVSTFLNNLCSPAVVRGYSDARKLFFAGCLTFKSSWTALCSLAILLIPILCLKNSEYRLSGKLRFLNSYFVAIKFVFFKFIFLELFLISDRDSFMFRISVLLICMTFCLGHTVNVITDSHLHWT